MQGLRSHEIKILTIPIAIALITGVWLGTRLKNIDQARDEIAKYQSILTNARAFQQSVLYGIDRIRMRALQLYLSNDIEQGIQGDIIDHWAEADVQDTATLEFTRKVSKSEVQPFEERYLDSVHKHLNIRKVFQEESASFLVRYDLQKSNWHLVLGFPVKTELGETSKMVVVLVDPTKALPPFSREHVFEKKRRAYLVSKKGRIIAHTQRSFIGANLKDSTVFSQGASKLDATNKETSGVFSAIDQMDVRAALLTLSGLPFHVVVEEVITIQEAEASSIVSGLKFKFFGELILTLGLIVTLTLMAFWFVFRRRSEKEPVLEKMRREVTATRPASGARQAGPIRTVRDQSPMEQNLSDEQIEALLGRFESYATHIKDPRLVNSLLAESVAEVCNSQTLLFDFDRRTGLAKLETDAGFQQGQAPAALNFRLDAKAFKHVMDAANGGQLTSLSQYQPLSQILLKSVGVAVFEAWPLIYRNSTGLQLAGVLVILQSGVQSNSQRNSLLRMMKTTARIYGSQSTQAPS